MNQKLFRVVLSKWRLYLFLLIPLVFILVFAYYPMLGIQISFRKFDLRYGIWGSEWVGFHQFKRFFSSIQFERILQNTITLSLYTLVAGFPLPILFALILNALPYRRFVKLTQTVTYMPHFISTVVMVGIIMQVFNQRIGIFSILYSGITGNTAPDLLGKPMAFSHLYVWTGVWQSLGWNSIIYFAALSGVDPELHEAAEIDGATRFSRVLHIDLPSILPTASIMLILAAGRVMNVGFEKVFLMQNNMNISRSEVISTYVYQVGMVMGGGDFSFATAVGLFNSVINFALIILVNFICSRLGESSLW